MNFYEASHIALHEMAQATSLAEEATIAFSAATEVKVAKVMPFEQPRLPPQMQLLGQGALTFAPDLIGWLERNQPYVMKSLTAREEDFLYNARSLKFGFLGVVVRGMGRSPQMTTQPLLAIYPWARQLQMTRTVTTGADHWLMLQFMEGVMDAFPQGYPPTPQGAAAASRDLQVNLRGRLVPAWDTWLEHYYPRKIQETLPETYTPPPNYTPPDGGGGSEDSFMWVAA